MSKPASTKKPTKVSRFFRVAVEGATTDGRKIERAHLEQMAASYSRDTYSARISVEHIKGLSPDSPFGAYGDVAAVKTEEVTIAGKKKLALFAQIIPTEDLIALNGKGKKLYTSIEINPEFADTGGAYLVGLAVTDNPASLGTEALEFAAKNPAANQWTHRKSDPDNVVTSALEFTLEMDDAEDEGDDASTSAFRALLDKAVGKFKRRSASDDDRFAAVADSLQEVGDAFSENAKKFAADMKAANSKIEKLQSELGDMQTKFAELEKEPSAPRRPIASGGAAGDKTDC